MKELKELKEVQISGNTVLLNENFVRGNILPEKVGELDRDIIIKNDTIVEGAVFARKLEIQNGENEIRGAVFTQLELHINTDAKGKTIFRKAVGSANSVVSYAHHCKLLFLSDINAKEVKLHNAFVAGSIFADTIVLENCVVIGGVFGSADIDIKNCIVGTFNGNSVKASGKINLLLPSVFASEKIKMLPETTFYNLSLADLGALYRGVEEAEHSGKISMNMEADELRSALTSNDKTHAMSTYSVVGKVLATDLLDTDKLQNHFLISAASLGSQLLKTYDLGFDKKGNTVTLSPESISDFFFDILHEKISVQDMEGSFSIDSIVDKFN